MWRPLPPRQRIATRAGSAVQGHQGCRRVGWHCRRGRPATPMHGWPREVAQAPRQGREGRAHGAEKSNACSWRGTWSGGSRLLRACWLWIVIRFGDGNLRRSRRRSRYQPCHRRPRGPGHEPGARLLYRPRDGRADRRHERTEHQPGAAEARAGSPPAGSYDGHSLSGLPLPLVSNSISRRAGFCALKSSWEVRSRSP
jgi:hypothetical protein